jgi:hypothetical protein
MMIPGVPILPTPVGPYPVTATTFIRRILTPTPVGPSFIKRDAQLEPTLLFEEVTFTVFAPTNVPRHG